MFSKLPYLKNETLRGLKQSRQGLFSILISIGLCSFLMATLLWGFEALWKAIPKSKETWEIQAYIGGTHQEEALISRVEARIKQIPSIAEYRYISKEQAMEEFMATYDPTLLEALDSNPLPPSFIVVPTKELQNSKGLKAIQSQLQAITGIEAVSPISPYLEWVETWQAPLKLTGFILLTVVGLAFAAVLSANVRLSLYNRQELIESMLLVGASRIMIMIPFSLEAGIIGLGGGLVGVGGAWGLVKFFHSLYILAPEFNPWLWILVPSMCFVLAQISGFFTVWRFIREKF